MVDGIAVFIHLDLAGTFGSGVTNGNLHITLDLAVLDSLDHVGSDVSNAADLIAAVFLSHIAGTPVTVHSDGTDVLFGFGGVVSAVFQVGNTVILAFHSAGLCVTAVYIYAVAVLVHQHEVLGTAGTETCINAVLGDDLIN